MLSQLSPRLQLYTMYCVTIKICRLHYPLKTLSANWMLLAFLDLDMHVKERFVSSRHDYSCLSWLYVQYGTFQQLEWILGKLRDWNCYFVGRYLPRGVFHRKGIEFDNFFAEISSQTRLPLCEKGRGRLSNYANRKPMAKGCLSVFPEILAELLLTGDSLLTFMWILQMRLRLTCNFVSRYFPRGVFETSHWKGIVFDNVFAEISS